jgi:hypothetical protein
MNGPWQSHLLGVDARGRARSGSDKTSGQNSALEDVIGRLKNHISALRISGSLAIFTAIRRVPPLCRLRASSVRLLARARAQAKTLP